jgi:hypothetical protein
MSDFSHGNSEIRPPWVLTHLSGDRLVKSSTKKTFTDLRKLEHPEVYLLLLTFARETWPRLRIVDDMTPDITAVPFLGNRVARLCPHLYRNGIRFGALSATRTQADRYACISHDGAIFPVQILYHFELSLKEQPPVYCSVVRRMLCDDEMPSFPWDL